MVPLPTMTSATWTVTRLRDSLVGGLEQDEHCRQLRIFAYAVTQPGWHELRETVEAWRGRRRHRRVLAYVGTDHALTDPAALRAMRQGGIEVRIMRTYVGVFHPKVFWLNGPGRNIVWAGSNNLTNDGLLHNIEFATVIHSDVASPDLERWYSEVHAASETLDDEMLRSYEIQRQRFASRRRRAGVGTFTWSQRTRPPAHVVEPPAELNNPHVLLSVPGDLITEVTPRETGTNGSQMQFPMGIAAEFFGLPPQVGASRRVTLTPVGTTARRTLTLTIFEHSMIRLSINELDYRDRPFLIVFHPTLQGEFTFEIVRQSIFPARYRRLLRLCVNQTRAGSRRWVLL